MDKSFYGHKRQTNSVIASQREGIFAPVTFSSLFFWSVLQRSPVPGIALRVPFQRPVKAYKEASKTSKAFT